MGKVTIAVDPEEFVRKLEGHYGRGWFSAKMVGMSRVGIDALAASGHLEKIKEVGGRGILYRVRSPRG